jgi:hypothetical protein
LCAVSCVGTGTGTTKPAYEINRITTDRQTADIPVRKFRFTQVLAVCVLGTGDRRVEKLFRERHTCISVNYRLRLNNDLTGMTECQSAI